MILIVPSLLIGVIGPVILSGLGYPWWVGVLTFLIFAGGGLALDIMLLMRRSKDPDFNPWNEI